MFERWVSLIMGTLVDNSRAVSYPYESWESMRSALLTRQVELATEPSPALHGKSEKVCQTTQTEPLLQRADQPDTNVIHMGEFSQDANQNIHPHHQYFQVSPRIFTLNILDFQYFFGLCFCYSVNFLFFCFSIISSSGGNL